MVKFFPASNRNLIVTNAWVSSLTVSHGGQWAVIVWRVSELWMTCEWLVNDLWMTCEWPVNAVHLLSLIQAVITDNDNSGVLCKVANNYVMSHSTPIRPHRATCMTDDNNPSAACRSVYPLWTRRAMGCNHLTREWTANGVWISGVLLSLIHRARQSGMSAAVVSDDDKFRMHRKVANN
jgi:hypothetical protein